MKILSGNIRYFGADDGDNDWIHRREACAQVMLAQRPDIIGVQEMWQQQFADLEERLPGFASYSLMHAATSRHPANCIFYNAERFALLTAGGYWLSDTPHVPGSKSWDSADVRLANWVRLFDKQSDVEFRLINTHLDHIGRAARQRGAALICEESAVYPSEYPQVLIGDMNCNEQSAPIALFKKNGWRDSHEAVHGAGQAGQTFHGFQGDEFLADYGQLDWIFVRGALEVLDAAVVRDQYNGRFPSDHYFMTAEVALV